MPPNWTTRLLDEALRRYPEIEKHLWTKAPSQERTERTQKRAKPSGERYGYEANGHLDSSYVIEDGRALCAQRKGLLRRKCQVVEFTS
eukprot:1569172-Amphidinium_carterae.1